MPGSDSNACFPGSLNVPTGGSPPGVIALTPLAGDGLYRVDLSGPIEVGEWTTVELPVLGNVSGLQADLCFQVAPQPGEVKYQTAER